MGLLLAAWGKVLQHGACHEPGKLLVCFEAHTRAEFITGKENPELDLLPQLRVESNPDVHQPKVFYFFVALCL